MLSDAHHVAMEEFSKQMREHILEWTRSVNSRLFEGAIRDRGAVIARSNTNIRSTCWIRRLLKMDGSWKVVEDSCRWIPMYRKTIYCEKQQPSVANFASIYVFFEAVQAVLSLPIVKTWGWARVCKDIIQFSLFGCLQPIGTINLCTAIVPVGPVLDRTTVLRKILNNVQHSILVDSFGYFFVQHTDPSISSASSSESLVSIRFPSPEAIPATPTSSRSDSRMHFTIADIPLDEETADQISMPTTADLSRRISSLETALIMASDNHDRAVSVQTDILCKEMKDQKAALSQEFGDQLAAIRNDLIELRVESQQNFQTLSSQLSEIIAYINRGGDAKKGEVVEVRILLLTIEADMEMEEADQVVVAVGANHRGKRGSGSYRGGGRMRTNDAKRGSSRGPQPPPDNRSRHGGWRKQTSGGGSRSEPQRKRGSGSYRGGGRMRYWLGKAD
ncbi:pentatricopeptide repeat-containing protein mitochondrial-like [Dorcoceras hygrometricum]|uniref:Pentatricopeptide repeat-containing protein mitochondrial-like n=1 Tax=Dorcoceras hygrometricum TaxID=472368 RepID=A0A2Z7B804_9LAMI|nr:pentatricopeptide repeat-containing protein mitochondrial-like [Dorcoceras hygrometricum]